MTWKWAGPSVAYSPPGRPASQPAAGTRVSRGTGGGWGGRGCRGLLPFAKASCGQTLSQVLCTLPTCHGRWAAVPGCRRDPHAEAQGSGHLPRGVADAGTQHRGPPAPPTALGQGAEAQLGRAGTAGRQHQSQGQKGQVGALGLVQGEGPPFHAAVTSSGPGLTSSTARGS